MRDGMLVRVRGSLGGVGTVVAWVALSGLVLAACSSSPAGPAHGSGSGSTTTVRVPPRLHATGSTSTTAGAAGTTTTAGGGAAAGSGAGPKLGVSSAWGPAAVGFGQVRPAEISVGGDPSGELTGVTWQSWGGSTATGTGTGTYIGPNQTAAQGMREPATVVAFDLGACGGVPAYQQVKWYFPEQGEAQSIGANTTFNACSGP